MSDPAGTRDIVRFEVNERVDLPDMEAMQDNSRSEARLLVHQFLFGHGAMGVFNGAAFEAPRARAASSNLADSITNWSKGGQCCHLQVQLVGTTGVRVWPTYFVDTYGSGPESGAFPGTTLSDGATAELGASTLGGDSYQELSFVGKPSSATPYGVWISATFDPAQPGTRLFWNSNTGAEDVQAIDTRRQAGWEAVIADTSGGAPSDAYILVATVDWDGSALTNLSMRQNHLFEGYMQNGAVTAFEWGDGANDRNANRDLNGVSCFQDWAAAIRRQLKDIIGDAVAGSFTSSFGWWTAVPTFDGTGGGFSWTGENADLTHLRDHVQLGTNPHGALLSQQDLSIPVSGSLNIGSIAPGSAATANIYGDNIALASTDTAGTSKGVSITGLYVEGTSFFDNTADLYAFHIGKSETLDDGKLYQVQLGPSSWQVPNPTTQGEYNLQDPSSANRGGTMWQYTHSSASHFEYMQAPLSTQLGYMGMMHAVTNGCRIRYIHWFFFRNPSYSATNASAARLRAVKRNMGSAVDGDWSSVKVESLSDNATGTGDLTTDVSTGAAPQIWTWDLTAEPTADWQIGGLEEWALGIKLEGDGSSGHSPYFVGAWVELAGGRIL